MHGVRGPRERAGAHVDPRRDDLASVDGGRRDDLGDPQDGEAGGTSRMIKRTLSSMAGASVLALYELSAIAAPKPETGWDLPVDVSKNGHEVDWLINITMVFLTILFIIMCVWMGIALFKHNKDHVAEYDHGSSKHSVVTALLVSAVIFFVVDGNLWAKSTFDVNGIFWNFDKVEAMADVQRIEINARQWIWDARYAGPDGNFNTEDDALVTNDIRVPEDTPIYLQLASPDVIHSFYLPNLRIKSDAVPGMINRMWFQAMVPGEYDIACAQHCGANHYKMKGTLIVLSKADFATWLKTASDDSKRIYMTEDTEAHWGWPWRKPKD
jgi:cytochrome c oxidase subunit 2